jgi:hypothetical protein
LREAGFGEDEIATLLAGKIISQHAPETRP